MREETEEILRNEFAFGKKILPYYATFQDHLPAIIFLPATDPKKSLQSLAATGLGSEFKIFSFNPSTITENSPGRRLKKSEVQFLNWVIDNVKRLHYPLHIVFQQEHVDLMISLLKKGFSANSFVLVGRLEGTTGFSGRVLNSIIKWIQSIFHSGGNVKPAALGKLEKAAEINGIALTNLRNINSYTELTHKLDHLLRDKG